MNWACAFAIVVLGVSFIGVFRRNISGALDRVQKAKVPGFELQMAGAQELGPPVEVMPVKTLAPAGQLPARGATETPTPNSLYDPIEAEYVATLEAQFSGDLEMQRRFLTRALAMANVERSHEANYRIMFGSQLAALKGLNERGGSAQLKDGTGLYDTAFVGEMRDRVPFDRWWGWLETIRYVVVAAPVSPEAVVTLTPLGRDFLMWMVGRGVAEHRPN